MPVLMNRNMQHSAVWHYSLLLEGTLPLYFKGYTFAVTLHHQAEEAHPRLSV